MIREAAIAVVIASAAPSDPNIARKWEDLHLTLQRGQDAVDSALGRKGTYLKIFQSEKGPFVCGYVQVMGELGLYYKEFIVHSASSRVMFENGRLTFTMAWNEYCFDGE